MQVGEKSLPILSWQPNVVVPKQVSVEIPEQSPTDTDENVVIINSPESPSTPRSVPKKSSEPGNIPPATPGSSVLGCSSTIAPAAVTTVSLTATICSITTITESCSKLSTHGPPPVHALPRTVSTSSETTATLPPGTTAPAAVAGNYWISFSPGRKRPRRGTRKSSPT